MVELEGLRFLVLQLRMIKPEIYGFVVADNVVDLSQRQKTIRKDGSMYKTIEQIHNDYDGQWIFMINCQKGSRNAIIGGEVVLHSENRDVVIRGMGKYDNEPSLTYFRYAGKIPEGMSVI